MTRTDKKNGSTLGFEADLFKTADNLRGNMEPSDYKHVVLGLIFLKYISDAFESKHLTTHQFFKRWKIAKKIELSFKNLQEKIQ